MKYSLLSSSDFRSKSSYTYYIFKEPEVSLWPSDSCCVYCEHLKNAINETNDHNFKASNRFYETIFETNSITIFLSVMFAVNSLSRR